MGTLLLHLSGRRHRKMIVPAMIPALIVTTVIILNIHEKMNKTWYLHLSISSSVYDQIKLFYDIGHGLNEDDSVTFSFVRTDDFLTVLFPLPNKPVQYLRLDPLNREGQVLLKDLKIVNGFHYPLYSVPLESVRPLHQIRRLSIQDNMLAVETAVEADDPMLFLDLDYPLANTGNISIVGIYAAISLLGSFMLCYAVSSLGVNIFLKIKQAMDLVFPRKDILINLSILVVSAAVSIAVGYIVYRYIRQPPETLMYQGQANDYALSFYNSHGQKISELDGTLKLKLDPFTIYANYPNQRSASYSINSDGFRDTYIMNPAPEQLAVVLGGSAAFGQGLSHNNETFSSQISRLNQKYHVINAGVVGFASGQELSQMIHVLDRFAPAIYIVFDGWNDLFGPYMHNDSWPINGGPIGFNSTFFMIEKQLSTLVENKPDSKGDTSKVLASSNKTFKNEREYFQAILSTYLSNIDRMNAFAKARNADFLVVFQPGLGNKNLQTPDEQNILRQWEKAYSYLDKGISHKYKQLIQQAKTFCREQNIAYLDINEKPEFSDNANTLFYDVVHPNEQGHKVIAELINDYLRAKF